VSGVKSRHVALLRGINVGGNDIIKMVDLRARFEDMGFTDIEEDGSSEMLHLLAGTPEDYVTYAREYFEIDVPAEVVARFFALEPFTESLARELHPDSGDSELAKDPEEIGYPVTT
jgi:hypothetical protein